MRLINIDGEFEIESSDNTGYKIECKNGIVLLSDKDGYGICEFMMDDVPTVYDVDKVVEQMEEYVRESRNVDYNRAMIEAVEIVKSGMKE